MRRRACGRDHRFAPINASRIAADAMTVKLSEPRLEPVAEAIDPSAGAPTPQPQP